MVSGKGCKRRNGIGYNNKNKKVKYMSTTINQTITTAWESIEFTHLSNVSFANKSVVQLWAGSAAPSTTSYGHTLEVGVGVTSDSFADGDLFWVRSGQGEALICATKE